MTLNKNISISLKKPSYGLTRMALAISIGFGRIYSILEQSEVNCLNHKKFTPPQTFLKYYAAGCSWVAGFLGNQEKLYHYFDKLIALTVDPIEHERRLSTRPKREFGDDEQNIKRRLEKYSMQMTKFITSGLVVVDNSGPVKTNRG